MSEVSSQPSHSRRGANRDRILRAALEVISKSGVDKVTHRSVASLANVSPGTTTYHFDSRETLVREAFALYIADYEKTLVEMLTARPIFARADIVGFLAGMTTLVPDGSGLVAIEYEMILFAARDHATKMRVAAWSRTLESWLSDPLERLGATRPLEAARILVSVSRGSEFEVLARGQGLTREQFEHRTNSVLDALLSAA